MDRLSETRPSHLHLSRAFGRQLPEQSQVPQVTLGVRWSTLEQRPIQRAQIRGVGHGGVSRQGHRWVPCARTV